MKEFFPLKKASDVVKAVLTEIQGTEDRLPNLAALSILLGLVEQQLTNVKNLTVSSGDPSLLVLSNDDVDHGDGQDRDEDDKVVVEATTTTTTEDNEVHHDDTLISSNDLNNLNNGHHHDDHKKLDSSQHQDLTSTSSTTKKGDDEDSELDKKPKQDTAKLEQSDKVTTTSLSPAEDHDEDDDFFLPNPIPFSRIKVLLENFKSLVKGYQLEDIQADSKQEIVARVADMIWSLLSPSVNSSSSHQHILSSDATTTPLPSQTSSSSSDPMTSLTPSSSSSSSSHSQFLTSLLIDRRLDSFGLTFAVISCLQVLFPKSFVKDFLLTLSEDHSWISVPEEDPVNSIHGPLSRVEVTWHAKNDKRVNNHRMKEGGFGGVNSVFGDNWLYLRGHAVVCNRIELTIAALISSLNPSMNPNVDSLPVAIIQRNLLKLFHDKNYLTRYPMAIGNLADLYELTSLNKKINIPFITSLYYEGISSSIIYYEEHHIYPYLYLAGFWFRSGIFGEALFSWKKASRVLSKYNYNPKEDEEAYKEFQEIASDLIPYALNQISRQQSSGLDGFHYRDLIEFYDGLCAWEESSRWPVLHIGWSKSFVSSLNKFPSAVRTGVRIHVTGQQQQSIYGGGNNKIIMTDSLQSVVSSSSSSAEETVGSRRRRRRTNDDDPKIYRIQDIVDKCCQDPHFLLSTEEDQEENIVLQSDNNHLTGDEDDDDEQMIDDNERISEVTDSNNLIVIRVSSKKMIELKDLLVKPEGKLNSSAIQLQITAQSSLFTFTNKSTKRTHFERTSSPTSSISPKDSQSLVHDHDNNNNSKDQSTKTSSGKKIRK